MRNGGLRTRRYIAAEKTLSALAQSAKAQEIVKAILGVSTEIPVANGSRALQKVARDEKTEKVNIRGATGERITLEVVREPRKAQIIWWTLCACRKLSRQSARNEARPRLYRVQGVSWARLFGKCRRMYSPERKTPRVGAE